MLNLRFEPWMDRALCAQTDPELFFPPKGDWHRAFRAKVVCNRCDVVAECLTYALQSPELDGVWGATTPKQRDRLRSRRGLAS